MDAAGTVAIPAGNGTPAAISVSGTYYIKSTTGSCSVIQSVVVTINPTPTLTIVDPPAVCAPTTVNITSTSVQTTNTGTTTTYWMDAAGTVAIPAGNGTPAAISVSGTYYIKSTTGSCSVIQSVVVTINPTPTLTIVDPPAVCAPTTVNITSTSVQTTNTGTTTTYWMDAAGTVAIPAGNGTPAAISVSGTYYIKSTTGSCSVIQSVVVTINPTPTLTIVDPPAVCAPTTVNITSTSVQTTNTGTTTTYWMDAAGTVAIPAGNGTPAAISVSGTYYIKSTTGSCSVIQPVVVTINPTPTLTIVNPPAVCSPTTVDITSASVQTTNTGTTTTYWMDAAGTVAIPAGNGTPAAISVSGTYYIKSTTGSCSVIQPVVVTINPTPTLTIVN